MIYWRSINSFEGNHSDPRLIANRPCPICGSNHYQAIFSFKDFQFFTDDLVRPKRVNITNVVCRHCNAIFMNPVFTDFGFDNLFNEAGCSYGSTEIRPKEQSQWLKDRNLLRSGNVLLDLGCYEGSFLAQLPEEVYRIGVDIDNQAIKRGRQKYGNRGVEFIYGNFDTFQTKVIPNTITMFHVLEHLPRPGRTLRNLRTISNETTQLVVEVPILENGMTNDINGFMSAPHMTHFSRHSFHNCLKQSGWQIVDKLEQKDYNGYRVQAKIGSVKREVLHVEEKDILTLERYLNHWRNIQNQINGKLELLLNSKYLAIWGGGLHTEFLYQLTNLFKADNRKFLIVDSDSLKQGKSWRGIKIFATQVLKEIDWTETQLLISSYSSQHSIYQAALERGVPSNQIFTLYQKIRAY